MTRRHLSTLAWSIGPPGLVLLGLIASGAIGRRDGLACLLIWIVWLAGRALFIARQEPTPPTVQPGTATMLVSDPAHEQPHSSQILLERLPDALFRYTGPVGARRIAWRNPAAQAAYGGEESALLRHPVLRTALAAAETSDEPIRTTLSLAAPMPRDVDVTIIPTAPGDAGPLYLLLTDRTRERGLEQMRADFVANASHELRTPLTSLIGFIETLRGPALGDAEALPRFLKIMAEQAERMQRIIADLLSLSRIEMTEHQPPVDLVEIGAVLRQVAAFMEPILRNGRTTLTLDIPEPLPPVRGDAGQLTQVFGNLIDNAVKYGALKHSDGGGTIRATIATTPSAGHPAPGLLISIADDGPGIAREHLPRLTERFYRADKGRSRAIGGTGLGLAIVKHVVSRHRGRLLIESTERVGTTFHVWLPQGQEPPPRS
ncbi:ATP-binding protein [Acidiphilium acidophilum]|uniref:sensor histidine kinase n=1 Tax=Acidiphilium acidophilum TaxID=76588 RepID=UPI002E8E6D8F|nr:ATP-binding protein [Acidiphilium acidophilum]